MIHNNFKFTLLYTLMLSYKLITAINNALP